MGLARKRGSWEWNRLDAYQLSFHQRVAGGFLELAQAEPARWVIVDAAQSPEAVQSAMRQAVISRIDQMAVKAE